VKTGDEALGVWLECVDGLFVTYSNLHDICILSVQCTVLWRR